MTSNISSQNDDAIRKQTGEICHHGNSTQLQKQVWTSRIKKSLCFGGERGILARTKFLQHYVFAENQNTTQRNTFSLIFL